MLGIAPIGRVIVALVPEMPAPITLELEPALLMAALGELIGGVVGLIVTPVELLEPDVPVLAPLFEGEPSRMVSRDTPGETDWVVGVSGLSHRRRRSTIVDLQSQFAWSRRVAAFDR